MSAGTVTAQILDRAQVQPIPDSAYAWAEPDYLLGHEATVALLIGRLRAAGAHVRYPERCLFAADHFVPPATAERASILRTYLDWLRDEGLDRSQLFAGISHQLMLEDPRVVPGLFIAGADSHTTTAGALGCAAAGFGSTDMLVAFAEGRLAVPIPQCRALDVTGEPAASVGGRDAALALMRLYGQGGLVGCSLEVHDAGGLPMALPPDGTASSG